MSRKTILFFLTEKLFFKN